MSASPDDAALAEMDVIGLLDELSHRFCNPQSDPISLPADLCRELGGYLALVIGGVRDLAAERDRACAERDQARALIARLTGSRPKAAVVPLLRLVQAPCDGGSR